jgi:hypothetical protein
VSFEAGQQLVGGVSGLRIVQSARLARHRPAQKLHRKDSLFVLWQGLESLQKLGCLAAYIFRLSIFRAKTQAGQPRRFRSAPNKTIPPANSTSDAGSGAVCSSIWNPDQEA